MDELDRMCTDTLQWQSASEKDILSANCTEDVNWRHDIQGLISKHSLLNELLKAQALKDFVFC